VLLRCQTPVSCGSVLISKSRALHYVKKKSLNRRERGGFAELAEKDKIEIGTFVFRLFTGRSASHFFLLLASKISRFMWLRGLGVRGYGQNIEAEGVAGKILRDKELSRDL